jgi:hypothetical protein
VPDKHPENRMSTSMEPAPARVLDDTCLTRPLILKAMLVIAGHQIRGSAATRPTHPAPPLEEVSHHG